MSEPGEAQAGSPCPEHRLVQGPRSDLIFDRSRKLVCLQSPAACATRAGGDSSPSFENYDLFHAQSPDTGRGVHARSRRTNRDVDVRR